MNSRLEDLCDGSEIDALRREFSDAVMMQDFDRVASLFTPDGRVKVPHLAAEAVGPVEIRIGVEQLQKTWSFFVQLPHPGSVHLDGNSASGRTFVVEMGRSRAGASHFNCGIYHDRYLRTPDGWRFTERVYELMYVDTTPLGGTSQPRPRMGHFPSFRSRDVL